MATLEHLGLADTAARQSTDNWAAKLVKLKGSAFATVKISTAIREVLVFTQVHL